MSTCSTIQQVFLLLDSAIVVDSNSKVNKLLTGLIRINNTTSHIDTSSGDLTLNPASNLVLTAGTVDLKWSSYRI